MKYKTDKLKSLACLKMLYLLQLYFYLFMTEEITKNTVSFQKDLTQLVTKPISLFSLM